MKKLLLAAVLLLSGCGSAYHGENFCARAGFQSGSPGFSECMMRYMEAYLGRPAGPTSSGQTLMDAGMKLMQMGAPRTLGPPPSPGMTCYQSGAYLHCQ